MIAALSSPALHNVAALLSACAALWVCQNSDGIGSTLASGALCGAALMLLLRAGVRQGADPSDHCPGEM